MLPTREGHIPFQPFYVVTCLTRLGFEGETRNLPSWREHDPAPPGPTCRGRGEYPQTNSGTTRRANASATSRSEPVSSTSAEPDHE